MNDEKKIGILRETKTPPDRRVPLTFAQCLVFRERFPHVELYIQPIPESDRFIYSLPLLGSQVSTFYYQGGYEGTGL